jgi:hypothetical protein
MREYIKMFCQKRAEAKAKREQRLVMTETIMKEFLHAALHGTEREAREQWAKLNTTTPMPKIQPSNFITPKGWKFV